ncbi:hypothetical protein [Limnospira fusiformis]|uniref:hypothetical protein n=1 Tax=Limnospira fusiformis TaxID=54297 RepID=UPI0014492D0C|nr:hypothetical protein HFV01_26890 [Limnospira fusiformis SAG 85.79]
MRLLLMTPQFKELPETSDSGRLSNNAIASHDSPSIQRLSETSDSGEMSIMRSLLMTPQFRDSQKLRFISNSKTPRNFRFGG